MGWKYNSIYEYLSNFDKEEIDKAIEVKLNDEEKELIRLRYDPTAYWSKDDTDKFYGTIVPKIKNFLKSKKLVASKPKQQKTVVKSDMNKEDCIKILEMLKTPTFNEMRKTLDDKSAVIIALRLGYVDETYFPSKCIASFLDIPVSEVNETMNKAIALYRDSVNGFIDSVISVVDEDKEKVKVKK